MLGWRKHKLESGLLGEISITSSMAESEEELKSLLKKVKEESEKVGLKLNIQKAKIMASDPITSWEIDGETVETVVDFIWGGGGPRSLMETAMATHSSTLAWKIPRMEDPGRLQSMGLQRVRDG